MATMIERVGRAIYEDRNGAGAVPWIRLKGDYKLPYLSDARAAIAAMREPTAAMIEAPLHYDAGAIMETPLGTIDARKKYESRRDLRPFIYRAMIDAALEEKL